MGAPRVGFTRGVFHLNHIGNPQAVYLADTTPAVSFPAHSDCDKIAASRRPRPRGKPSAAQNVTVVQTCTQCGAVNRAEASTCCCCDARLSQNTREKSAPPSARSKTPKTEGNLAVATDWRSEVTSRVEAYRARRKRLGSDSAQPEFSFGDAEDETPESETQVQETREPETREPRTRAAEMRSGVVLPSKDFVAPSSAVVVPSNRAAAPQNAIVAHANTVIAPSHKSVAPAAGVAAPSIKPAAPPASPVVPSRQRPYVSPSQERVEIDIAQPALDFSATTQTSPLFRKRDDRKTDEKLGTQPSAETSWAESTVVPVAPLAQRRRAGLLDTALLLFSYGAFLSLFAALGGHFAFSKLDVAVVAATLSLFYALYVALFTFFGGSTPGMMLAHLRVVSFDGSDPTPGQLLWRSFGYLVSAGTLMFGFLAPLWDEDHLTWHDRISQTYLTPADQAAAAPVSTPPREDYRHRG